MDWLCPILWPPWSPDITTLDIFLWDIDSLKTLFIKHLFWYLHFKGKDTIPTLYCNTTNVKKHLAGNRIQFFILRSSWHTAILKVLLKILFLFLHYFATKCISFYLFVFLLWIFRIIQIFLEHAEQWQNKYFFSKLLKDTDKK